MGRYRWLLVGLAALIAIAVVVGIRVAPGAVTSGDQGSAGLDTPSDRPAAPDFAGIDGWVNSPPLQLSSLRGQVVLVDFWTFSCVNCTRTISHLRELYDRYKGHGFTIVGVHSPEFDFEKVDSNVRAAVQRLGVTWPVAIDSEMKTWAAYQNRYWPAEYLIDQQGRIAHTHFGEGDYENTAAVVASLLGGSSTNAANSSSADAAADISPELYAGSERGQLGNGQNYGPTGTNTQFPDPGLPSDRDAITVSGGWIDRKQYLESTGSATVRVRFHARNVFLVAGSATGQPLSVSVRLDGGAIPDAMRGSALTPNGVTVARNDLFQLLAQPAAADHLLELNVPAGLQLFTFTFG